MLPRLVKPPKAYPVLRSMLSSGNSGAGDNRSPQRKVTENTGRKKRVLTGEKGEMLAGICAILGLVRGDQSTTCEESYEAIGSKLQFKQCLELSPFRWGCGLICLHSLWAWSENKTFFFKLLWWLRSVNRIHQRDSLNQVWAATRVSSG